MSISDRVRIKDERVLSHERYVLKSVTFDIRRSDGVWQTQKREVFDRGNAATLLPYNLANRSVMLVRQFRLPVPVHAADAENLASPHVQRQPTHRPLSPVAVHHQIIDT